MLGNDELDTEMQIRKDDFVSPRCRPIMKAYLGSDFKAEETFQQMDEHMVKIILIDKNSNLSEGLIRWGLCLGLKLLKLYCHFGLTRKLI